MDHFVTDHYNNGIFKYHFNIYIFVGYNIFRLQSSIPKASLLGLSHRLIILCKSALLYGLLTGYGNLTVLCFKRFMILLVLLVLSIKDKSTQLKSYPVGAFLYAWILNVCIAVT